MPRAGSSTVFETNTILSAAICSHAAYAIDSGDVHACLREWTHFSPYTSEVVSSFHRVLVSKSARDKDPSFLIVHTSDTTFVAFSGPSAQAIPVENVADFLDARFCPQDLKDMMGFALRVDAFDHIPLPCLTQGLDSRRIIFCGHSMGGTIAHSVQLQYFLRILLPVQNAKPDKSFEFSIPYTIYSIGFGSPHFCDAAISGWLKQAGLSKRFITIVNGDDPIPSLFEYLKLPIKLGKGGAPKRQKMESPRVLLGLSPCMNAYEIREKKVAQKLVSDFKKMQKSFQYAQPSKRYKKNFFASAGSFIRLEKPATDLSTIFSSEGQIQITEDSVHQHMLLGPIGYASQIIQNLVIGSAEDVTQKTKDESDKLGAHNLMKDLIPLIMQPQPFIQSAILDLPYEGGKPMITLYGRNLFFLLERPLVYRELEPPSDSSSLGNWKVIGYSNAGTSLKIVLDLPLNDEVDFSQGLRVDILTAFGSASEVVALKNDEEEHFMASNMWLECVESLSQLRKAQSLNNDLCKAVERCLLNLFFLSRVDEMDMDGRLFDIGSLSKLSDAEFDFLIDPLNYAVLFYLGSQWAFEMEQASIKSWPSDSGFLQFQDGEIAEVVEGTGSMNVAPVKLISHVSHEKFMEGYSDSKVLRQFSRSKILVLLHTFIANSRNISLSEFISLHDAEKEAELVAIAMENDPDDLLNDEVSDTSLEASSIKTVASNPYSIFAMDGNISTKMEAMRRIRVLVEVYRLYSFLGFNQ